MSDFVTGVTFGGTEWTPAYVTDINQKTCIGCGRCFKVCPRDVFDLIEKSEALDPDDFDDDYGDFEDDDDNSMVMSLKNKLDCIGCEACSKVCPKSCFTHEHKQAA
ncbi:MAG: ferredoxin III, nif-specific [Methylobacter sp.]|uniref:Ferredoxin III n=1 Tax=Methylobacter tundripaludum TaxID=173365 RepID=A0A2S6H9A6_9GAMM|nr:MULTISPECIES: ferredoxin III, nif-specific [Methylobacter]MDO9268704.1 ferredoxin III, nif-specific [Methylobacter sp.]MDP1666592.1 ferredoxin III, nif-specific [Methylobacter sp.]PPK74000.1 Nif-specific ferredoxin III [Methylobacter tundripaludum]